MFFLAHYFKAGFSIVSSDFKDSKFAEERRWFYFLATKGFNVATTEITVFVQGQTYKFYSTLLIYAKKKKIRMRSYQLL